MLNFTALNPKTFDRHYCANQARYVTFQVAFLWLSSKHFDDFNSQLLPTAIRPGNSDPAKTCSANLIWDI